LENTQAILFVPKAQIMKQAITIRIDPELLANARARAKEENRTLTNFLETALKERVGASGSPPISKRSVDRRKSGRSVSKGS
jgi:predicted HicB family RNase H-like nuclease